MARLPCLNAIPRLTKSVCGLSLQTGTKVISILNSLVKLLLVIYLSYACSYLRTYYHDPEAPFELVMAVVITLLVTSIFRLVPSILLISSAYTCQRKLAIPWLVVDMIFRTVDVGIFVLSIIYHDAGLAIITPIRIGIGFYLWLVVYNYYRELSEADILGIDNFSRTEADSLLRN